VSIKNDTIYSVKKAIFPLRDLARYSE